MAETYCGKTCEVCTYKAELNCPGCRLGPGRAISGECDIARCCRGKGYEQCGSCAFKGNCGQLRCRQGMAEGRARKRRLDAERNAWLSKRNPMLGKWLWILFWLVTVSSVGSLVLNDTVAERYPALKISSLIFSGAISTVYALIMLRLSPVSSRYRLSGICGLICVAVNVVSTLFAEAGWIWILTWGGLIPAFIREFQEYTGHSDVLETMDAALAEKWRKLWFWYLGSLIVLLCSGLLVAVAALLGLLVVIAAAVATLVVEIMKIIYIYRTTQVFRNFLCEDCSENS